MRIQAQQLTHSFGSRLALENVSFELPSGCTTVVLGANGSGKSTLLKILATLIKPTAGSVEVDGKNLKDDPTQLRLSLGYLGHEPVLYRNLTVLENLNYYAQLSGVSKERVHELIELAQLTKLAAEPVRNLSRGTAQRVAACRCSLRDPDLLLLDEPYANLDPNAHRLVSGLLSSRPGRTRLIVSHQQDQAVTEADYLLGLKAGKVAFVEQSTAVTSEQLEDLYSG